MRALFALILLALAPLSAYPQTGSVPFSSRVHVYSAAGAEATAGVALTPADAPDYTAIELIAGPRGAWVAWMVAASTANSLTFRVGAPFGGEYTVLSTATFSPHHSGAPAIGSTLTFGSTDAPLTADAATISGGGTALHDQKWSPPFWVPPGRALQWWSTEGATDYTVAVHIMEPKL
jgi:hypothetical protein